MRKIRFSSVNFVRNILINVVCGLSRPLKLRAKKLPWTIKISFVLILIDPLAPAAFTWKCNKTFKLTLLSSWMDGVARINKSEATKTLRGTSRWRFMRTPYYCRRVQIIKCKFPLVLAMLFNCFAIFHYVSCLIFRLQSHGTLWMLKNMRFIRAPRRAGEKYEIENNK